MKNNSLNAKYLGCMGPVQILVQLCASQVRFFCSMRPRCLVIFTTLPRSLERGILLEITDFANEQLLDRLVGLSLVVLYGPNEVGDTLKNAVRLIFSKGAQMNRFLL